MDVSCRTGSSKIKISRPFFSISLLILSFLPAIAMESQKIGAHIPVYNMMLRLAKQKLEKNSFALHQACRKVGYKSVKLLIDAGAAANAKDNKGYTPLHWAGLHGDTDVVSLLLNSGAEVNAENNEGNTPLHCAAMYGHTKTVQLLLDRSADVNAENNEGNTPLHRTAMYMYGKTETAKLLLSRFQFLQAKVIAPAETTYEDGWQAWDLKSLALMNILSNIENYDEEELQSIMQTYPTLLTNYKKILPFVDLTNKKIRRLLSLSDDSVLADYVGSEYLEQIKNLIELKNNQQETALDLTKCNRPWDNVDIQRNKAAGAALLEAVKNADHFDQLPEEIKQVAICRI